jgi:hypothetical protein
MKPRNGYNQARDITTPLELLDENVPIALLIKSIAMIELGGPASTFALKAFEADPILALLAANAIGHTGLTCEFLESHYPDREQYAVALWLLVDGSHLLVLGARTAVDAGFIRFDNGNAILVTPERMPSSYDYCFRKPDIEAA